MSDVPATGLFAFSEALQEHLGEPVKSLAQLPDGLLIVVTLVFVVIALIFRDALAVVWASLCCLVVIGALGAPDHLRLLFALFVAASSLLVVVRQKIAIARHRHLVARLDNLQQRIDRLEFALQNQFVRSLKELKRPIAPSIAPLEQDQKSSNGGADDARPGAQQRRDGKKAKQGREGIAPDQPGLSK
jgi:hypothetical protein